MLLVYYFIVYTVIPGDIFFFSKLESCLTTRSPQYTDTRPMLPIIARSKDGGRTWGPYAWAVSDHSTDPSRPTMDIGGNPSPVYDKVTGKLVLQFVRGLRNKKTQSQTCNPALSNWQQESEDGGLTWSSPVEISQYLEPWAGSLVGPANGIQLDSGRLVFCGHYGVYNSTQVWYSDDHGKTYSLSHTVFPYMDECTVAAMPGRTNTVYLNMRNNHFKNFQNHTSCDCRAFAISNDGGETFGPLQFDPTLISPVCQATLSTAGGALLFANPASTSSRTHGMIRKSADDGLTWSRQLEITPLAESVQDGEEMGGGEQDGEWPGRGGSYDYSCLVPDAMRDDPSVGGLLWSHLPHGSKNWLALFTRFPLGF